MCAAKQREEKRGVGVGAGAGGGGGRGSVRNMCQPWSLEVWVRLQRGKCFQRTQ